MEIATKEVRSISNNNSHTKSGTWNGRGWQAKEGVLVTITIL